ncbi:hypothetical protein OGATHE_005923 [Ogataea polymorpha]|uniref:Uncharacterized protein n=1 Tax=Ogataea polymorpha TaxID=460523 RepID=A0A9P8NU37_9ASCO|nr:hypothetical protein OGATHE_005923 [Ogataea polymorpha]
MASVKAKSSTNSQFVFPFTYLSNNEESIAWMCISTTSVPTNMSARNSANILKYWVLSSIALVSMGRSPMMHSTASLTNFGSRNSVIRGLDKTANDLYSCSHLIVASMVLYWLSCLDI